MSQVDLQNESTDIAHLAEVVWRHLRGVWRHRWLALFVTLGLSIAAWFAVSMLPDRYEASAKVYVDTDNVLRPLLKGLSVESDVMNDVSVMTRTLLTRPHLERVAREADLDLTATTPRAFNAVVDALELRIKIVSSRENIYTISFDDTKRDTALSVVSKLLDAFVEDTLGTGKEDSKQAERTLKAELSDYERRLTESEDRVKEFKRQNVGLMPDEHGDYYGQLQAAIADLADVQQKTRVESEKAASLARQLEGEEPVFGIMSSPGASPANGADSSISGQIAALEHRRSDLLIEYTEKHPEVVRIDQKLKELRAKQQEELASAPENKLPIVTNPLDINPVYQNLKIQRSNVEVELASLRAEQADKQAKVDRLKKLVDVIPQVEAELNRLNRDYEVVKARYSQMLQRWEDLQTAQRVKSGTDQIQFRIVDPPFVPLDPAGPPRALYLLFATLACLGAGIGVAFLRDQIHPVMHRTRDLASFGFNVLGSIAMNQTAAWRASMRRDRLALVSVVACLVIGTGIVMVFSEPISRLVRSLL